MPRRLDRVWIAMRSAPLRTRRVPPVAATLVAGLIAVVPEASGGIPLSVVAYTLPVVLSYACGAYAATRPGLAASAALILGLQIHTGFADAPNVEIGIAVLAPWWAGREVQRRRKLVRELAERARELEREEEAFVRLSVERERARIARDLHDIVSHHVAVMVIQAGAGRLAEPWDPAAAAGRFVTIRDAGVQALAEAERLVSALQPDPDGPAQLRPLLDRARKLGAHVLVTPRDMTLPRDLETLAHHVTREAFTNAMKHAPGARVDIRLGLDSTALTISVRNDRIATTSSIATTGSGLGLAGMRQRVAAAGGSLTASPDGQGFWLRATLPRDPAKSVAVAEEDLARLPVAPHGRAQARAQAPRTRTRAAE